MSGVAKNRQNMTNYNSHNVVRTGHILYPIYVKEFTIYGGFPKNAVAPKSSKIKPF